jgi:putative transposase
MKPENSLNHTKWECKYHIVWIPKYRKKSIYKDLREYLGVTLKDLDRKSVFSGFIVFPLSFVL